MENSDSFVEDWVTECENMNALKLYIELGIPIPEWFADNGFNDLDSEWDFPPKGHTEQE